MPVHGVCPHEAARSRLDLTPIACCKRLRPSRRRLDHRSRSRRGLMRRHRFRRPRHGAGTLTRGAGTSGFRSGNAVRCGLCRFTVNGVRHWSRQTPTCRLPGSRQTSSSYSQPCLHPRSVSREKRPHSTHCKRVVSTGVRSVRIVRIVPVSWDQLAAPVAARRGRTVWASHTGRYAELHPTRVPDPPRGAGPACARAANEVEPPLFFYAAGDGPGPHWRRVRFRRDPAASSPLVRASHSP